MSWYDFFKFLHVVFSIGWLGGGLAIMVLTMIASGKDNPAEMINTLKNGSVLADRLFPPSALGALVAGILMAVVSPGSLWGQAWFVLGLVGWAGTLSIGLLLISPRQGRLVALEAKEGASANVTAIGRQMLAIMKFDLVVLFTIVADMVLKPQWSDWPMILVFLLLIAGAGWLFLSSVFRMPIAARV